jgi:nucleotide-binding universal stress UspA family protein
MPAMSARIAVGVDGSPAAEGALEWAAAEADRRHQGLDVVLAYVVPVAGAATGFPMTVSGNDLDGYIDAEQGLLDEAVAAVQKRHPGLDVQPVLSPGSAAAALGDASRDASLVVVGSNGKGGALRALGSVSGSLAHHSHCPVVIVPETQPTANTIVVGIDKTAGSVRALRWALETAGHRGSSVTLISAWYYPLVSVAGLEVPLHPFASQAADALEHLEAALYATDADGTGLTVNSDVREGSPDAVLIEASATAGLVVVGAGHGFGQLGPKIAAHAQCPVVIVPEDDDHA